MKQKTENQGDKAMSITELDYFPYATGYRTENLNITSVCHSATFWDIQPHQPRTRVAHSREQPPGFTLLAPREKEKPPFHISLLFHSVHA